MKAVLAGTVIAEADDADVVLIEGNSYFPPSSVRPGALVESPTPYTCPWKGACQYYSVVAEDGEHADAAWAYPTPYPTAIERVGRDFSGYVAFAPGVEVGP
ncbi:uncharacterized protein (DUF427 family) [Microbacterium resistens]|uniref:Uncharacterized protein (DUF427 family) n=1 Tax=Microbacterium resistens TaxID=156977 RepID=A0ABU1SBJ2_9MICO|nr:DUF427 domain-containing protein [Microbacterium resistens]MDR6866951.1 uncharacterized protein (DUF427 family) [Microbacterium resistens]